MSRQIKQLENVIQPYLKNNQKYISCECKNLLSSGENYGSVMLQVSVKLENENGEEKIVECVGKTVPPTEMLWNLFNTKVSFKKEIAIYKVFIPELNAYGKENGIKGFITSTAKCFGARISLDCNSEIVDNDAVLLLENLKTEGYVVCNRYDGFDEECARVLLVNLATMHAAVIGYRHEKPLDFEKKMLPHLSKAFAFNITDYFCENFGNSVKNACSKNPKCIPHLSKIDTALRELNYFNKNPVKGKSIYTTLTHNDFWVNNILVKFEKGRPVAVKVIDYQIIEFSSLAHDVIFFLYSSVNTELLEEKIDDLIRFYYDKFIETLISLKQDVSEYSFESMMEEFAIIAKDAQFSHIMYMLAPIMMLKGKAKALSQFDLDDLIFEEDAIHENYFRRMQFVLLDFVRRGWL
ncbi:hypothetical protein Trydic_g13035 [Trypoxylus dichotomus]